MIVWRAGTTSVCVFSLKSRCLHAAWWRFQFWLSLPHWFCDLCTRYHVENTGSRPITEVKQRRARLVLGWVTAWEHQVLLASLWCRGLWIEVVPLVSGCCTLLGRVDGHHWSSSIPQNLSRAGSKRHTPGPRLSRRAKPREGVMLTRHQWVNDLHDAGYRLKRMKFLSNSTATCSRPRRATWMEDIGCGLPYWEGWALPCDIAQDTPHEDVSDSATQIKKTGFEKVIPRALKL